jgi:hypothetical protein
MPYNCDYFVHYYNQSAEVSGRYNAGGGIRSQEVWRLTEKVSNVFDSYHRTSSDQTKKLSKPRVTIIEDTEASFWHKRKDWIHKFRNTTNEDGSLTFLNLKSKNYVYPLTLDNIVKQWHSIESVWNLMEYMGNYSRVGMFRLDVMYVTPLDVYQLSSQTYDRDNQYAVYPVFSGPMNDRLVYGPHDAIREWATRRWEFAEEHARTFGGMTPEMFLYQNVRARMLQHCEDLRKNPDICFLRVRADDSVLLKDCRTGGVANVSFGEPFLKAINSLAKGRGTRGSDGKYFFERKTKTSVLKKTKLRESQP